MPAQLLLPAHMAELYTDTEHDTDAEDDAPAKVHACTWEGCTRSFKSLVSLKNHRHNTVLEFRCLHPDCGRAFAKEKGLRSHYRRSHPKLEGGDDGGAEDVLGMHNREDEEEDDDDDDDGIGGGGGGSGASDRVVVVSGGGGGGGGGSGGGGAGGSASASGGVVGYGLQDVVGAGGEVDVQQDDAPQLLYADAPEGSDGVRVPLFFVKV